MVAPFEAPDGLEILRTHAIYTKLKPVAAAHGLDLPQPEGLVLPAQEQSQVEEAPSEEAPVDEEAPSPVAVYFEELAALGAQAIHGDKSIDPYGITEASRNDAFARSIGHVQRALGSETDARVDDYYALLRATRSTGHLYRPHVYTPVERGHAFIQVERFMSQHFSPKTGKEDVFLAMARVTIPEIGAGQLNREADRFDEILSTANSQIRRKLGRLGAGI